METETASPSFGARASLIGLLLVTGLGNAVAISLGWCALGCGAGLDPTCLDLGCLGGPVAGLLALAITAVGALLACIAALGLGLRQWWGWWLAALVFTGFLCSSCMPLSLLGLVLLAEPSVRAFALPERPEPTDDGEE